MKISIPRTVLLIEIDRRCKKSECNARNRIGLTKEEASAYNGFECEKCEQWSDDFLEERDIPDWWEELNITGLSSLRPSRASDESVSDVIDRMSGEYKKIMRRGISDSE
jgi:hypothetical protein